jgi:hypothetical protein
VSRFIDRIDVTSLMASRPRLPMVRNSPPGGSGRLFALRGSRQEGTFGTDRAGDNGSRAGEGLYAFGLRVARAGHHEQP